MRLIERYLFRQITYPVLGATVALTAMGLLVSSLGFLNLIVERGQSPWVLIEVTLLSMPQLLSLILPVAVFTGALLALNRLQTEHEFVVCFAGGMSRWRVISPAVRLAVIIALVSLFLNLFAQPLAFRTMRNELFRVRTDLAASLIKEGDFTELASGLTVYTQSVDQSGQMKNVFIHTPDAGGASWAAREGKITKRNGEPVLILRHGSRESYSKDGVLDYLSFDENTFDLSPYVNNDDILSYKSSDLWLHELFSPNKAYLPGKHDVLKNLAEAHSRLSGPLYNIAFMGLALAAVLGGAFSRLGYNARIIKFSAIAALVRVLGVGVAAAAGGSAWLNLLQYAVPLATIIFACRILFRQRIRRSIPWGSEQLLVTSPRAVA
jgi:lipopolysaccharide export system permease protein